MKKNADEAMKAAKGWSDLLRQRSSMSHFMELSASSMVDLIDTLEGLIEACTKLPLKPKNGGGGSQAVKQNAAPKGDPSSAVA